MSKHNCIVCGSYILEPLYHPKDQPLAALNLPKTKEEALKAPHYPLEFVACVSCGHIFNVAFDYQLIPYEEDSNLMYNAGAGWREHLEAVAKEISKYGLKGKTIIDIGCGDGGFLEILKSMEPKARYIGFEPGIEADTAIAKGLEIYKDYFLPKRDIESYKPDILVCRHVVEHLENPREFVEHIAYYAALNDIAPIFAVEVPNIENALTDLRVADYLYEHVSNFTPASLEALFELCGFDVMAKLKMYQDKVALFVSKPNRTKELKEATRKAVKERESLKNQAEVLHKKLEELKKRGKKIALWGATGKGASFINSFELDCESYPVVVDSDERKCGRYTPGTGQLIRHSAYLLESPCEAIVATANWRAMDIAAEIKRRGIECEMLLVVKNGEMEEVLI